ncbi:unnamed protein product [Amoebophrya sp. A120]|nr:unnamed protein product [Amoebophrya sp. A120]|eukprot:GSA120T00012471001.1
MSEPGGGSSPSTAPSGNKQGSSNRGNRNERKGKGKRNSTSSASGDHATGAAGAVDGGAASTTEEQLSVSATTGTGATGGVSSSSRSAQNFDRTTPANSFALPASDYIDVEQRLITVNDRLPSSAPDREPPSGTQIVRRTRRESASGEISGGNATSHSATSKTNRSDLDERAQYALFAQDELVRLHEASVLSNNERDAAAAGGDVANRNQGLHPRMPKWKRFLVKLFHHSPKFELLILLLIIVDVTMVAMNIMLDAVIEVPREWNGLHEIPDEYYDVEVRVDIPDHESMTEVERKAFIHRPKLDDVHSCIYDIAADELVGDGCGDEALEQQLDVDHLHLKFAEHRKNRTTERKGDGEVVPESERGYQSRLNTLAMEALKEGKDQEGSAGNDGAAVEQLHDEYSAGRTGDVTNLHDQEAEKKDHDDQHALTGHHDHPLSHLYNYVPAVPPVSELPVAPAWSNVAEHLQYPVWDSPDQFSPEATGAAQHSAHPEDHHRNDATEQPEPADDTPHVHGSMRSRPQRTTRRDQLPTREDDDGATSFLVSVAVDAEGLTKTKAKTDEGRATGDHAALAETHPPETTPAAAGEGQETGSTEGKTAGGEQDASTVPHRRSGKLLIYVGYWAEIKEVFETISLCVICLFMVELVLHILANGLYEHFFVGTKMKIAGMWIDAIVVPMSFIQEVVFPEQIEELDMVVALRLWRIVRIFSGEFVFLGEIYEDRREKNHELELAEFFMEANDLNLEDWEQFKEDHPYWKK